MNHLEITDRNISISIPDHWDYLDSQKDIRYVLSQCLAAADGKITENKARVNILYRIADIRRNWKSVMLERIMSQEWNLQKNANIYKLADEFTQFALSSLHSEPLVPEGQSIESIEVTYSTVMNHFQQINVTLSLSKRTLIGPAHQLADCSFGEFRAALEELDEYFQMRNDGQTEPVEVDHQLCRFIACLYRPVVRLSLSKDRQPFDRSNIEKHAKLCKRIDPVIKVAILLWFTYTINFIQENDITISGRTINLRPLFPKPKDTGKKKASNEGSAAVWSSILYQIAKDGPFGKIEETDRAGLYDILLYMYEQYRENQRQKLKTKKKS